jgi:mannose-6-phosphate isomerase
MNEIKSDSVKKLEKLELGDTTALKITVWRVRTSIRNRFKGRDILDVEKNESARAGKKIRYFYRQIDKFMADFFPAFTKKTPKKIAFTRVRDMIEELGYSIVEADEQRPWGAFYRLDDASVARFIREFFPGLSLREAKLGHSDIKLSPKFLVVSPGERLSWQFHHRRAERWRFLTSGSYYLSGTDKPGKKHRAFAGESVQFGQGERHRLCADPSDGYVLVAEIWQHTDPNNPSNEADIIRLADDYERT